jgi:Flp pilus assembly protein TadD
MRRLIPIALLVLASCSSRHAPQVDNVPPPAAPALANWNPTVHLADVALSNGSPQIALQISDELLKRNPRDAEALDRRGDALAAMGRTSEADVSYQTALIIKPRYVTPMIGLARVRMEQDPAKAELLLGQAVILEPHNAIAWNNLGVSRDLQGKHPEAQDAYRKALGAEPDAASVQVNLGLSLALSGNTGQAIQLLRPLASKSDASPRVKQDLAVALALNGNTDEAAAILGHDMSSSQARAALDGFSSFRP